MNNCEKCGLEFGNKGAQICHQSKCNLNKEDLIVIKDKYVNLKYTIRDIKKDYNLSSSTVEKILKGLTRSLSEARKISTKNLNFKHSEESKQKMREARLKYMKEHPENTA